ncbi:hypothetical protein TNCV_4533361 [Trichonephila clavipes]|nr:hypothetical protein TNCV_4533361 [Trichonephila clavipes]
MFELKEKALFVKLLYQSQKNSVKEFRRLKQLRRGPMFPFDLRMMIHKFVKQLDNFAFFQGEDESTSVLAQMVVDVP